MSEIWKDIPGFEDYKVSNMGAVLSKQRKVDRVSKYGKKFTKTVGERLLKAAMTGSGYEFVCLRKNNQHYSRRVHRLVAKSFVAGELSGLIVHHKNGVKTDNRASNLEWISKQKNTQHYYRLNGFEFNTIPMSDIPKIQQRVNSGEECQIIAKEYGVKRNDIAVICKVIKIKSEELNLK